MTSVGVRFRTATNVALRSFVLWEIWGDMQQIPAGVSGRDRATLDPVPEPAGAHDALQPVPAALEACLVEIGLCPGQVLETPGTPITQLFFPNGCLVSLTAMDYGRTPVGVGLVGRGRATGLGFVLGTRLGTHTATVETAGAAWLLAAEDYLRLKDAFPEIHRFFLDLALAQLKDMSATAFAQRRFGVASRLAWWLLRASTACEQDNLRLSQSRLAMLIGARRESVTTMLADFEAAGAIRRNWERIDILNCQALSRFVRVRSGEAAYPDRPRNDGRYQR